MLQTVAVLMLCLLFETTEQLAFRLSGRTKNQRHSWLIAGIAIHVFNLAAWFWLLQLLPLGVAIPLMGISYAVVPLISKLLFKERVTPQRWAGIGFIIFGLVWIKGHGI